MTWIYEVTAPFPIEYIETEEPAAKDEIEEFGLVLKGVYEMDEENAALERGRENVKQLEHVLATVKKMDVPWLWMDINISAGEQVVWTDTPSVVRAALLARSVVTYRTPQEEDHEFWRKVYTVIDGVTFASWQKVDGDADV